MILLQEWKSNYLLCTSIFFTKTLQWAVIVSGEFDNVCTLVWLIVSQHFYPYSEPCYLELTGFVLYLQES